MKYLTIKEVADMLQLTERGIQKWVREGKIVAMKLGREYRIEKNDLEEFLESRKNNK
jgi:excisionase family DNA binding protein